jgi:hypothetical protein
MPTKLAASLASGATSISIGFSWSPELTDKDDASMYDLIGDIHGYASELKALLAKMGYQVTDGIWQHPVRKAILLGYFVDRGPEHSERVNIARTMVESENVLAVMGNYEYNAVAWATPDRQDPEQSKRLLGSDGAKLVFLGQYWLYSETVKLIKSMIPYE